MRIRGQGKTWNSALYNAEMPYLLLWIDLTNFFNLCKFIGKFVVFDDVFRVLTSVIYD